MKKTAVVGVTVAWMSAVAAHGAGYALYEGSARGNVDSAGLAAKGGEPGALYFNPAAIAGSLGTQIQGGVTIIAPEGRIDSVNPYTGERYRTEMEESIWTIPAFFVTHALAEDWTLGFGVYSRFGLGAEVSQSWPGRYGNYKAIIQAVDFNPSLAWRVNKQLALSFGVTARYFDIELAQKIDAAGMLGLRNYNDPSYSPYDIDQNLHGDDIKFGINLGVQYTPTDVLSFGAAYHSRIKFKVKGDAKWDKPAAVDAMAPMYFNDTGFSSINWNPDMIVLAAAWDVTDKLTLALGLTCTLWSVYDDLEIKLNTPALAGRDTLTSEKQWHDAWRVSVSASYALTEALTGRIGYTLDSSPLNSSHPDYLVPADTRHLFSGGFGWNASTAWTLDVTYFFEAVEDETVTGRPSAGVFDEKFASGTAHALAFSATRRF